MSQPARFPAGSATGPDLLAQIAAGNRAALARAISIVENQGPAFRELLQAIHPHTGRAHRVGITGPPGAGKSTLVAALVALFRARQLTVAVIAVDPTSPFTGGALLGDRIRMNDIALDRGVFIRSMATRGYVGGLALTTEEVADVLDAAGFDRILIETVGVGQTELDIAAAADSTVVVLVPESGDGIQAMKAGLMEVSDLFVINKADRPGADRIAREVSLTLHLRAGRALRNVPAHHGVDLRRPSHSAAPEPPAKDDAWEIPVLQTVANTGQGMLQVADALQRHFDWLVQTGERMRRRRTRLAARIREEVDRSVRHTIWSERHGEALLDAVADSVERGETTPYDAARTIIADTLDGSATGHGGS